MLLKPETSEGSQLRKCVVIHESNEAVIYLKVKKIKNVKR